MRVELRVEARNDLTESAACYEAQRDGLGDYFVDCLFADLETLASHGGIHEIAYGLHRQLSKRFPFAVYFLPNGRRGRFRQKVSTLIPEPPIERLVLAEYHFSPGYPIL